MEFARETNFYLLVVLNYLFLSKGLHLPTNTCWNIFLTWNWYFFSKDNCVMAETKHTDAYKAPFKLDRIIGFKHNTNGSENCVSDHTPNLICKVLW